MTIQKEEMALDDFISECKKSACELRLKFLKLSRENQKRVVDELGKSCPSVVVEMLSMMGLSCMRECWVEKLTKS